MTPTSATVDGPRFSLPMEPMYIGSWVRVPVFIPNATVDFDNLRFTVDPPDAGCQVSRSKDQTFDPTNPHVILIAGGLVCDCRVRAVDSQTGAEVMAGDFSVTDAWTEEDGPPLCVTGRTGDTVLLRVGRRATAVVILEAVDVTPLDDADAARLRSNLETQIFGGVSPVGDFLPSVNAYFAEASLQRFELGNAGVVGPVRLPNTWSSYSGDKLKDNFRNGLRLWATAGVAATLQRNLALAAAGQPPLVDLEVVESILFVVRSLPPAGSDPRGLTQWPWASGAGYNVPDFQVGTDSTGVPVTRTIEVLAVPDDWESIDGRTFLDTVAHEMCHNLGLDDQYGGTLPAADRDRDVEEYSLMSESRLLPFPTAEERLALGWVDPSMIGDLGSGPADTVVTLRAASLGEPAANEYLAVRIPKSATTSYLFEYRAKRPGTLGDQFGNFPVREAAVVGIETQARPFRNSNQPRVLRLRNDEDGDRGVFTTGGDYTEEETINPEFPRDLQVDVLNATGNTARVRFRYGDRRPDPAVTPFSAGTDWKSPDLEVVNERAHVSPEWRDTPWNDHPNWVVARVRNEGELDAPHVSVEFYYKNFTLSADAPQQSLGFDIHKVVSGHETTFRSTTPWIPKAVPALFEHYCVGVNIFPYSLDVPGHPSIAESDPNDNWAQSNHARFMSGIVSPASREIDVLAIHGTDRTRAHYVSVEQTSPFARTYLEHAWLVIESGQMRTVTALTEFVAGDDSFDDYVNEHGGIEVALSQPNVVRLSESVASGCSGTTRGGASLTVHLGRATEFQALGVKAGGKYVYGRVNLSGTHQGVDGTVIVTAAPVDAREQEVAASGDVTTGIFGFGLDHPWSGAVLYRAEFLHTPGVTSCRSEDLVVDV